MLLTWSSPRMTWVMPVSASSTVFASTNSGAPVERATTKSSTFALSKVTSPRTLSGHDVLPSGTRKRSARPGACSNPRSRQKPS